MALFIGIDPGEHTGLATDFEIFKLTRHILNTCVNGKSSGSGVGNTLIDHFDGNTTLDEVVERFSIVQTNIHLPPQPCQL